MGDQYIFYGELQGDANIMIETLLQAAPAEQRGALRSQLRSERPRLMKQLLANAIERKLMYIEFRRNLPAKNLDEILPKIDAQINDAFSESLFKMIDQLAELPQEKHEHLARRDPRIFRLANLMKLMELTSLGQLEAVLRTNGSSLNKQRQAFGERIMGQEGMKHKVVLDPEVTHQEMLAYYHEHHEEFQVPARARWEQITIRFSRCENKAQADEMINALGREIYYGGAPFWAVAKRSSHGSNADKGGLRDWTEWGDLEVSREINDVVFSIERNRLSGVLKDDEGLHIVRVLEREQSHVIPFTEAQVDIEQTLKNKKRSKSIEEYVAGLRERTPVW